MKTSNDGIALIKKYEGCKLTAYKCPAGVWTIGYGHTRGVTKGMTITQEIADLLLREDVAPIEKHLNDMRIQWRQGQFDACVSFIFNLGIGNFNTSTLKKRILEGAKKDKEIVSEFKRWNKAGGKVLSGLVRRREEEAATWML